MQVQKSEKSSKKGWIRLVVNPTFARVVRQSESSITSPESSRLGWKTPLGSRLARAYLNTWGLPPTPDQLTTLLHQYPEIILKKTINYKTELLDKILLIIFFAEF